MTREKEEMRLQMEAEMREMKGNIERLQRMEHILEKEGQKLSHQKELQFKLQVIIERKYYDFTVYICFQEISSENHDLKRNLAENHVELAMIKVILKNDVYFLWIKLQSELAHVRADYEQRQNELISERRMIESKVDESENMQKQLQLLL